MSSVSMDKVRGLMEALGQLEEPMGAFYTNEEPVKGYAPKPGPPISAELEAQGQIDWQGVWGNFSCVLGNIWLARKKKAAAYLEASRYGCLGGSFYLGFHAPQLDFIAHYVSQGIPGVTPGENYLPSPDSVRGFFKAVDPLPAPARFGVFKHLSAFQPAEEPLVVIFFARGEVLAGLCQLAQYTTGDLEVVAWPFGAACSNLVSWPLVYERQGRLRAVVGGSDPSSRKFMKTDELTFAVPTALFKAMLEAWPSSFLTGHTWEGVYKKVLRSRQAWDED